ncbi:hypothetical protein VW23_024755 [Devosia insulae DS-56]|uniref:Uncharacterized protein n=1 Tax=Devosia insulae DS-56 TaxID=1116389 RepID=A0A1E5XM18_9HYPH|nr:hypothetical protein [Devosia insulae]OEO29637.1 hypothetical protein VW23_024755 [Devosia insulae DS-56]
MSVSRDRLAPGQSRVSTVSAFGRIGLLTAAVVLSLPAAPHVAQAPAQACTADHTAAHCPSIAASIAPR